ncbi:MAG: deoxyhypusine synthase family protein [Gammaproteobacteria bacterium]|nr:deoxyhypusine synthase family protein [Gammaproteobacteria bacterium]
MGNIKSPASVEAIEVKSRGVSDLLAAMGKTAYQGRTLAEAAEIWQAMLNEKNIAIVMGLAGSMSTAGQWKLVRWLIEQRFVDVLVSTGANVSEDIVEAMGYSYKQGTPHINDEDLLAADLNRYYDVYGKETDYREMEELLTGFMSGLPDGAVYSSMELLHLFGKWLGAKGINSILAAAARHGVPVFSPALFDSAFGEAYFMAKNRGRRIVVDQGREFDQFVGIGAGVGDVGVIYIGGGVPKDFTQLMAISLSPRFEDEAVPGRRGFERKSLKEFYYPHRYAIQITTDSPQWGGLSGCTLDEAVSWGKVSAQGRHVTCYCDATIALPILTHALAERVTQRRHIPDLNRLFNDPG